jgi:nucleotide-binding universal stress UspA family protein
MLTLRKILCPVDFSGRSPVPARYAAALACHFHSELILLHVIPLLSEIIESDRKRAQQDMEDFLPELSSNARRTIISGDPAMEVVRYVKHEDVGLIVMPTHGRGPFRRFLFGSVTAKVLHDVDCPVLTGVHVEGVPDFETFGMSRIACAIDSGPDGERVLSWADQFANGFGSRLTIVHISTWDGFLDGLIDSGWRANLAREGQVHVEMVRSSVGVKADIVVETDRDVPSAVASTAAGLGANLMIIGRGGFGKSVGRLRANSYAIIRQSPCPVISV